MPAPPTRSIDRRSMGWKCHERCILSSAEQEFFGVHQEPSDVFQGRHVTTHCRVDALIICNAADCSDVSRRTRQRGPSTTRRSLRRRTSSMTPAAARRFAWRRDTLAEPIADQRQTPVSVSFRWTARNRRRGSALACRMSSKIDRPAAVLRHEVASCCTPGICTARMPLW